MVIHKALWLLLILSACPAAAQMQLSEQQQWPYRQSIINYRSDTNLEPSIKNSAEQQIRERLRANEERKKQQQKRLFDADKKRWGECYGIYQYDWQSWKKAANGTWVTDKRLCVLPNSLRISPSLLSPWPRQTRSADQWKDSIAVTFEGLKISELDSIFKNGWSKWKDPDSDETEMLVKLCSREKL